MGAASLVMLLALALIDARDLAKAEPWTTTHHLLVEAALVMAAAGLALIWAPVWRTPAAEPSGLDRLAADLPVAIYQGLLRPDGSFQRRYLTPSFEGTELIGTLSDITSTHELMGHAVAVEARFRGFLEASPDAIVVTDEA
jgi:PAS domain-containing protein